MAKNKWERREIKQVKKRDKKELHSNRKALRILEECQAKRYGFSI